MATFIMMIYGPTWFAIIAHPSCTRGAYNLWTMIRKSRYLQSDLRRIIEPVIQRMVFFGHPENLFICMLADDRKFIRELGYRRILKARCQPKVSGREFVIPPYNIMEVFITILFIFLFIIP